MKLTLIRFSLRKLLFFVVLSALTIAAYQYVNRPFTTAERIDNSFDFHAIGAYPEVHRFGFHSEVLHAIAKSTPESLQRPAVVASWVRPDTNELVVLFLASSVLIDGLSLRDDDETVTYMPLRPDQLAESIRKRPSAIDFQIDVSIDARHAATLESIALTRDNAIVTDYFSLRRPHAQDRAEP
ncbi:hypothetical protein Q31b_49210 [Novipirellula aureliae]|uniref:Uncharacterized protein n=1 Tax=Novipirellula aureliae TaxID=2527966 RepID=A0A5C6DIG3_9BACT|nr:hypothetical protein [Novipirellula aureliae]TWU36640.1 hypothetical protein Q31b_49210 [Novipirellula aureliae]